MGEPITTGDDTADQLLRVILAFAQSLPLGLRQDVRDAVTSMFFNFRYLAFQAHLDDVEQVRPALELLQSQDLIRCAFDASGRYGVNVWIRHRLEEAA